jgi:hypothetical protein
MHPALLSDDELLTQCDQQRLRRSGPGGQRRNKVETAVRLTHRGTGIVAEANERRSTAENLRAALGRLRMTLAVEVRSQLVTEGPSDLWRSRLRNGRLVVSPGHADLPRVVCEALDQLAAVEWDLATAAARLQTTPSQVTRLLRREPRAMTVLNAWRIDLGLRRLS